MQICIFFKMHVVYHINEIERDLDKLRKIVCTIRYLFKIKRQECF